MKYFFFFLSLSFVFISCCYAQEPAVNNPLVLSNISEQNGLSDDHVQCVLKDKEGFVWQFLQLLDTQRLNSLIVKG